MSGYQPGEQPKELNTEKTIKLNTNENPYSPSPKVKNLLSNFNPDLLRLYPDPKNCKLRRKIAEMQSCQNEQVFIGNGADEILALCSFAFVENNGNIGFFDPSYSLYPVIARIRGVSASPVETGINFEWSMPKSYSSSLFFLTNPNAPTGILFPKETVENFCKQFRGIVVIDEAYVEFAHTHCIDLGLKYPNVLILRTLSKAYSLAGIRVGYAIGSSALIEALFKIKDSYNVNQLSQQIALAALADTATMHANAERIKQTRSQLSHKLTDIGFHVYPSETNFLWVKPENINAEYLYKELRKQNIFVRYFPNARTKDFLRITIGTDVQTGIL